MESFGIVKFYSKKKGFGIIKYKDRTGNDLEIFAHFSNIESKANFRQLTAGDSVSFNIKTHPKFNKEQAFEIKQTVGRETAYF